jgi:hypothetical protein
MGDEPRFPSPDEAKKKPASTPSSVPTQPARPVIVRRAEPIVEEASDPQKKAPVKLSPDEVRALLAVDGANRPSAAKKMWRRGRVAILPTALLQIAAYFFFGSTVATWLGSILTIAALAWCAIPLFKKDEWG